MFGNMKTDIKILDINTNEILGYLYVEIVPEINHEIEIHRNYPSTAVGSISGKVTKVKHIYTGKDCSTLVYIEVEDRI